MNCLASPLPLVCRVASQRREVQLAGAAEERVIVGEG